MKIKVDYLDGTTVEALAGPRAEVEVERRHDIGFHEAFSGNRASRIEFFYTLAWASVKYSGQTVLDHDEWLETIADATAIEEEPAETAADPTPPARRRAKSSG